MVYYGTPVLDGVIAAPVYLYVTSSLTIPQSTVPESERPAELERYHRAVRAAKAALTEIYSRWEQIDTQKAEIFQAQIAMLEDVAVAEEIEMEIGQGKCAPWAVQVIYDMYAQLLGSSEDELIRERSMDLQDVSRRLAHLMLGLQETSLELVPDGSILAAHDLLPSQTAMLDATKIRGIVTEVGGLTSHTAILARSFGIPAILGVSGILSCLEQGQILLLDAENGQVITQPTSAQLDEVALRIEMQQQRRAWENTYLEKPAVTTDGMKLELHLNIESAQMEQYMPVIPYVDGVGLFRSEFLYMSRATAPCEEEQYQAYLNAITALDGKPVILRTMDIGGDKQTPCLPMEPEENPFLGLRALRLCFTLPEIFLTQLRAAYRAAAKGPLWLMFPMVNSIDDIRRAKDFCHQARASLEADGLAFDPDMKIGVMIETPALALMADSVAQEVDFASIGTNDLCQYALAADRMNPAVSSYYQGSHPAVLRMIAMTADAFNKAGKPLSICGELGGDRYLLPALLGMGVHKVSMGKSALAAAKATICNISFEAAKKQADYVLHCKTETEIRDYIKKENCHD